MSSARREAGRLAPGAGTGAAASGAASGSRRLTETGRLLRGQPEERGGRAEVPRLCRPSRENPCCQPRRRGADRARRKRRARVKTHRLRVCSLDWPHAPALVPSGARRRRRCVLHGAFATGGSRQRRFRDGDGSYKNEKEKTCYVATSHVSRLLGRFSCEAIKHIFVRYRSMKKRIRSFSRLFLVASIEMHPIECENRIG